MKKLITLLLMFVAIIQLNSCTKKSDAPTASDNILNYEIAEIPVTSDFNVGAIYYNFSTFNTAITEVPAVGKYSMLNGLVPPTVMTEHIQQAKRGGIDYFLFQYRSVSRDLANFRLDSTTIKSFLDANGANLKFALAYNFSSSSYGISNAAPLENDVVKLEQFFQDIIKMTTQMGRCNEI